MSRIRIHHVLIAILLVVIVIVVPPMIGLKSARVQAALSSALGRPVTVGETTLRLFPAPGFDMKNVVIGEDPAYGAEPMIRAEEVRATLRFWSLWRGRVEIARLTLKYPSFNLVRRADGHWNLESLVERATKSSAAPTTKPRAEARPRFPYIESDTGRINFKFGIEKKVFSLTEADFALWQEAENEWRVRVKARPVRTDMSLSDTGVVRLEGSFQRAQQWRDTPINVRVGWEGAQLGQLTSLVYGRDRGWRGAVQLNSVTLSGTPAKLAVAGDFRVDDFRRYDIFATDNFRVAARCSGTLLDFAVRAFDCALPAGDGLVKIAGAHDDAHDFDIRLNATNVPADTLAAFARHAKRNLPDDLSAAGLLNATFTMHRPANASATWDGGGETSAVVLRSRALEQPLTLGTLKFKVDDPGTRRPLPRRGKAPVLRNDGPSEIRLVVSPFTLPVGKATLNATAWFSATSYNAAVKGEAEIAPLVQLGRAAGLRIPEFKAEGRAALDVNVTGSWAGFASPKPLGIARLRDVTAPFTGASAPLHLASADLHLDADAVSLEDISGNFTGVPMTITGSVQMPRQCETLETCPVLFDLHSEQVNVETINALFNPAAVHQPWYRMLVPKTNRPPLLSRIRAGGRITAGRLVLGNVVANKVVAQVELAKNVAELRAVDADVFGGRHFGTWRLDFTGSQPKYSGTGDLKKAALQQVAAAMKDKWASGAADVHYALEFGGNTSSELWKAATGKFDFDWRNGELRHVTLGSTGSNVRFAAFTGEARLRNGTVTFAPGKMQTPRGLLEVSGTAALAPQQPAAKSAPAVSGVQLDLTLRDSKRAFSVRGAIEQPRVAEVAPDETRAALAVQQ